LAEKLSSLPSVLSCCTDSLCALLGLGNCCLVAVAAYLADCSLSADCPLADQLHTYLLLDKILAKEVSS
jgi:hypothetical protein